VALRDLVLALDDEAFLTPSRNVNWMEFARDMTERRGVKYETLRKAVAGERPPGLSLLETVAATLGIEPAFFVEYRLAQAQRDFDPHAVGFEEAVKNLRRWTDLSRNS
jgi:transcriptional regulator with XRE-family HTH domain